MFGLLFLSLMALSPPAGWAAPPGAPASRLKPKLRGKDGSVLLLVPAGPFVRGSKADEGHDNERPQKKIKISGFYIDKTEVSTAQYLRCVEAGKCQQPAWAEPGCKYNLKTGRKKTYVGFVGKRQPIVGVDWDDADAYCRWVGRRLPTEAEWEKAARGIDGRTYPWGSKPPTCARAAFDRGEGNHCRKKTAQVTAYRRGRSPYGALNMAGNVWEWVADRNDDRYYEKAPDKDPPGPSTGDDRVMRGGSWNTVQNGLRCAYRITYVPAWRSRDLGFRCAMTPK